MIQSYPETRDHWMVCEKCGAEWPIVLVYGGYGQYFAQCTQELDCAVCGHQNPYPE